MTPESGVQVGSQGQASFLLRTTLLLSEVLNRHLAEPRAQRLKGFLEQFAKVIVEVLPSASTATLVAWDSVNLDEDIDDVLEPLAMGSSDATEKILTPDPWPFLERFLALGPGSKTGWFTINNLVPEHPELIALSLTHGEQLVGTLLIQCDDCATFPRFDESRQLSQLAPLLTANLQAAIRAESWGRLQQIDEVMREFFADSNPQESQWNLQNLVRALSAMYQAEGVTLFLVEQDVLMPAASTDTHFEDRTHLESPVDDSPQTFTYRRGEGLTGWVFERGRSLRIRDEDKIIMQRIGLERHGPTHVDHDGSGPIIGQFLGAPLRLGTEVVGVLRLSRRSDLERFTYAEEKTLQYLADLLGSALGNWKKLHLAEAILDSISEGIAVSQRVEKGKDTIVSANPGIARLLGSTTDQVEGMNARKAYAPGEYEELFPKLSEAKKKAHRTGRGEVQAEQSSLQRADGTIVPVMISFRIQTKSLVKPPVYSTIAIARDLSEQAELADRYRRLREFLDAIDVAYFRADTQAWTLDANDADFRITGYSKENWQTHRRTALYREVGERERLLERIRGEGGTLKRHLLKLQRKGGEVFWAEVDLRLIYDATGREVELEGFYRDVTAQMSLQGFLNDNEERLLSHTKLFERLKETAELQIDYLSSIGHQIQAPLGFLLGTLDNLENGTLTHFEFRHKIPSLRGQLLTCSHLVRNLSYMDMVLRREAIRFQQVRLRRLIEDTCEDFATAQEAKKIRLKLDRKGLKEHLEVTFGHKELLRQVLVNLIDNAIKYSLPHTAIEIRGEQVEGGRGLLISNRGIPIHPRDRRHLFTRGFRAVSARALVPHGTGLGLWLVREILELHRSTIELVEETREQNHVWNVFRVTFPEDLFLPPKSSPDEHKSKAKG